MWAYSVCITVIYYGNFFFSLGGVGGGGGVGRGVGISGILGFHSPTQDPIAPGPSFA